MNEEGGPQILARLLEDTLYRATQINTDMDRSGELVLALSNPDFEILASCWYNYTQNYKKNTMEAKRHHDGKGINAKISLHNAPRVGVQKFVIYIHWSSANVNFIGDDCAANANTCAVDSKDAKSIVPGDIAAVQKPIKTCKQRSGILLDHDWEQGRTNTVTPVAHLFFQSKTTVETPMPTEVTIPLLDSSVAVSVTRTGQTVNLIYLLHYEPETVFHCFNELFLLLVQPSLDRVFRNPETGALKNNFVFIVVNGPSEQPSSSMVQICLARLCKLLNLDRVTQVSFAEYNSKRNLVKRVHPQVNKALSAQGAFSSHAIHPDVKGAWRPRAQ